MSNHDDGNKKKSLAIKLISAGTHPNQTQYNLTGFPRFDWVWYEFGFFSILKHGHGTSDGDIGTHYPYSNSSRLLKINLLFLLYK